MADSRQKAVLAVNQGVYDAIEGGDIDLMRSLWAVGDDVVCIHPGAEPTRGTSAVLRSWSMVMANTGYIQFILTDVSLAFPTDDVAVVTCTENVLAGGDEEAADTFLGGKAVASNIFKRTTNGWRLWMRHSSPVATMTEGDDE